MSGTMNSNWLHKNEPLGAMFLTSSHIRQLSSMVTNSAIVICGGMSRRSQTFTFQQRQYSRGLRESQRSEAELQSESAKQTPNRGLCPQPPVVVNTM